MTTNETFLTREDVERIRRDERRATVERLRERLNAEAFETVTHPPRRATGPLPTKSLRWPSHEIQKRVRAILDEEAAR
jgi:hypothetical protein